MSIKGREPIVSENITGGTEELQKSLKDVSCRN